MKKRIIALLLVFGLLVSLIGCTRSSGESDVAPPETSAHDEYAQAIEPLKAMSALTMSFRSKESHQVWQDNYLAENEGTAVFEGIGGELLAQIDGSMRFNNEAALDYSEFFVDGMAYVTFDGTKIKNEVTGEDYLARQYPVVLFDAAHFENGTKEELANGLRLSFTGASELEDWVALDYAILKEATAEMVIGPNGVESMRYTASFRQGASDVEITVETGIKENSTPLTLEAPADNKDYTAYPYTWIPQVLARAISNYASSNSVTLSTSQIISSQAVGAVKITYADRAIYNDGSKPYYKLDLNLTVTDGKETNSTEYSEILKGSQLTTTYDGESTTTAISADMVMPVIQSQLVEYLPETSYITSVKVVPAGEGLLLEMDFGSDDAIKNYRQLTDENLTGNPRTLDDMASDYKSTKLTGYMGIDPDTWLPTSFGVDLEGIHVIQGYECILSQQYSSKIFASDPNAYKEITEKELEETAPENPATPLFYHVTGEDGSEMWLLGTIHIGDERTGFLPQEIYDAFDASDALAVEFNMNTYEEEMEEDEEYQATMTEYYFYSDESTVDQHLDPEVYEEALVQLKYTGNYNANMPYAKPFVWENLISNAQYIEGRRLFSSKGVDQRLLDRAEAQGKEILDVESAESQLGMFSNFSDKLQEYLLKSTLSSSRSAYNESVLELFELWCSGDEQALIDYIRHEDDEEEEDMTEEEKLLYEEYQNAMQTERDIDMVAVAKEYLSSGKTVFYAVGLAHLLSENGLVDALRAAGYTVELVSFAK